LPPTIHGNAGEAGNYTAELIHGGGGDRVSELITEGFGEFSPALVNLNGALFSTTAQFVNHRAVVWRGEWGRL